MIDYHDWMELEKMGAFEDEHKEDDMFYFATNDDPYEKEFYREAIHNAVEMAKDDGLWEDVLHLPTEEALEILKENYPEEFEQY